MAESMRMRLDFKPSLKRREVSLAATHSGPDHPHGVQVISSVPKVQLMTLRSGALQLLACLVLPALVCAAVYALLRPVSVSIAFAAGMAALYAALLSATRLFLLEQQYTVRAPTTLYAFITGSVTRPQRTATMCVVQGLCVLVPHLMVLGAGSPSV